MLSNLVRGGVLAAFLLTATAATAQQPLPAQPIPGTTIQKTYRAKEVLGTKVSLKDGTSAAGVVDDLVFDEGGNLEYLIVENGGKLYTVPFDATTFDPAKKIAILPITVEQYKVIPTFTTTTYPTFYAPAYRTEVYKVYGLTPRDLRAIRRR
jgi:PRC-barrel domain